MDSFYENMTRNDHHVTSNFLFPDSILNNVTNCPLYILAIFAPFQLLRHFVMNRQAKQQFRIGKLDIMLKVAMTLILTFLLSWKMSRDNHTGMVMTHPPEHFSTRNQIATYIFVVLLTILTQTMVSKMTLTVSLFWLSTLASTSVNFYQQFVTPTYGNDSVFFWIDVVHITIAFLQCCLMCVRKSDWESVPKTKPGEFVHPQERASWLSDVILSWALKSIRTGSNRILEETDVCDLAPTDQCRQAVTAFEQNFRIEEIKGNVDNTTIDTEMEEVELKSETADNNKREQPITTHISLLTVLIKTFAFKFFSLLFLKALGELLQFISPVIVTIFMNYIQNREHEHWTKGIGLVFAIFVARSFKSIFHNRIRAMINRVGRKARSSIMLSIFKKSLSVRNECTKDITVGEIVNMVADDSEKVVNMAQESFQIITTPMVIGVSLYLLHNLIGQATFVGLLIMILTIPLNKFVSFQIKNIALKANETKEKRIKIMNEIVNGIKVLKLYAWELSFMQKVQDIRNEENCCNDIISLLHACVENIFRAIPFLVKLGSLYTFLLLGGRVDPATGFVAIELFHIMNHPFCSLSLLVPHYVEALVSYKRIDRFLNGKDIPHDIVEKKLSGKTAVSISQGKFSYERKNKTATLKNINLDIPKGKLVAVVGMVGSGKSSLLSAILGEMEKLNGNVKVQGQIAYVPQEAWILNVPLRKNILFGLPMDVGRYRRVVNACALREDIKMMGAGDKTEIGEKGINLSGGQKQRVSLARAVYNDADVYLLDDPLSAVDAHVGRHIFNKVISNKGVLRDKTRVLVTHGIHWLSRVDFILVMKDGQISESGTYEQLISHESVFAQFLRDKLSTISENTEPKMQNTKQTILKRLNSINERDINDGTQDDNEGFTNLSPNTEDLSSSSSGERVEEDLELEDLKDLKCGDEVKNGTLIADEDLEQGRVKFGVYIEYIKAIGYNMVVSFILVMLLKSVFAIWNTSTVKQWTDDPLLANQSLSDTDKYVKTNWGYFYWFAVTGTIEIVAAFTYVVIMIRGTFRASTRLHNNLLYRILRCPMSFFDTTPSSRIITRFSKDVSRVDGLGGCLRHLLVGFVNMNTFLFMTIFYCPPIVLYLIPISLGCLLLFYFHFESIRQIRRYKSKLKTPIFIHFTETLNGLASIRAYKAQQKFISTLENCIDQFMKHDLMEMWSSTSLGLHSMLLCHLVGLATGFVCVMDTGMTAGTVGIVIMYAGKFSRTLFAFLWHMTQAETEIVALERVIEYSNKPSEAAWEIAESNLARDWPNQGHVSFNDCKARYREGLDLVLKGVNCQIKSGEKVGIVGRTGAGKTSLAMAFFRLLEAADGDIQVDKQIIAHLGLHDLRSRINIMPQEPVIFSGSLRMNLDPFEKRTDEDIWTALQHSHLASFVEGLPEKLDFGCGEGGKNFSVGQKQLLCLTRTLLCKAKILVLDEATAAVDMETDQLIQKTIRTEFKDCTVLAIAHRLNTIMDYDKIMVMENGMVKEFDSPNNLLADQCSTFYGLAKDANLVT